MVHIYHPNKSVKGFACSFWYSERDGSLYATIIKQSGWDDKNQNGIFKASLDDPSKKVNIKLSAVEASAILDCIERNRPLNTYHSFGESPKSVSFVPWMITPPKDEDDKQPPVVQKGFSFAIVVNNPKDPSAKNSFYIGLTFAEARYVREFLIFYLHTTFKKRNRVTPTETAEPVAEAAPVSDEPESPNNGDAASSNSLVDF